jgi:undecaprenyl-diphosphatase
MALTRDRSAAVRQSSDVRFGARAVLAASALALVAVPFGLLLFLVQGKWRPLLTVDDGARDDLHGYAVDHTWFVTAMKLLGTAGSSSVYLVVFGAVAGWLAWQRHPRLAAFVVVTMVGNSLLNTVVKAAVNRARPVLPDPIAHANGMSFPSGHAQAAVVAYSVLLLVFLPWLRGPWRRIAVVLAVLMVLAIGFSRVALGVHYASDVLAGFVLGAAWVTAMTAAFAAWRRERGKSGIEPTEGLPADD